MYTFSFIVGSSISKSVKCIHSATESWGLRTPSGCGELQGLGSSSCLGFLVDVPCSSRKDPSYLGFRVVGCGAKGFHPILGGSWVVVSGVISKVTIVITRNRGLINPLITTHEPSSRAQNLGRLLAWQAFVALVWAEEDLNKTSKSRFYEG